MKHSIIHHDREINFSTKVNKRAKRIILKVSEDGVVSVTIPRKKLEKEAIKTVQKKAKWILRHQNKIERIIKNRPKIVEKISFLGKQYAVEMQPNSKKLKLNLEKNKFVVKIGEHTYEDVREELKKWYIKKSKKIIPKIIKNLGYSNKVKRITIKGQKTRWGSCSSKKNLNFNWRLMMAPTEIIHYVVAHELAHLKQMNHSAKFWSAVEGLSPNYKRHRGWLKQHGKLLRF